MEEGTRNLLAIYLLMDSSSSEDDERIESKQKRVRRRDLYEKRDEEGAFNVTVARHLMDNDTKFQEYFRVSPFLFNRLLDAIELQITKPPSIRYPRPIEPKLKLCVTLR